MQRDIWEHSMSPPGYRNDKSTTNDPDPATLREGIPANIVKIGVMAHPLGPFGSALRRGFVRGEAKRNRKQQKVTQEQLTEVLEKGPQVVLAPGAQSDRKKAKGTSRDRRDSAG